MKKLPLYHHFIDNQFIQPHESSSEVLESLNPYLGGPWALFPAGTVEDINHAVHSAHLAFKSDSWSKIHPSERAKYLFRLADLIEENAEHLARIETTDNGKLLSETRMQMRSIPKWFRYYAGLADKTNGQVVNSDKPHCLNYTQYLPLGVIGVIVPWNSPLLVSTWKLAPLLAAGNTCVVKPSEHASISHLELAKLIQQANFPPGVVNIVTGLGSVVGEALVDHPLVAKIAFTGGTSVGKSIYARGAKWLKPCLLELGGKSPNIIFEDAHFENALNGVMAGIFAASGQSCIAGSRVLVQESIYEKMVSGLKKRAEKIKMGDPLLSDTELGPICNYAQLQKIKDYVTIAQNDGAKLVFGGNAPSENKQGLFFSPTLFSQVTNSMRIAQEEVFGPICSLISFKDEEEAIHIANDTVYGLAAGVWTENFSRAQRLITSLEAQTVWWNTYRTLSYLSPFGGFKQSGLGRESSEESIYEYLQSKSVYLDYSGKMSDPFVMR